MSSCCTTTSRRMRTPFSPACGSFLRKHAALRVHQQRVDCFGDSAYCLANRCLLIDHAVWVVVLYPVLKVCRDLRSRVEPRRNLNICSVSISHTHSKQMAWFCVMLVPI